MKCDACGATMESDEEAFEHLGKSLCEDCYMDALSPAKACDPWAVHTAKSLTNEEGEFTLTEVQAGIMDLIEDKGRVTPAELMETLGLTKTQLEREVAALRHMEKLRGSREEGELFYRRFDDR